VSDNNKNVTIINLPLEDIQVLHRIKPYLEKSFESHDLYEIYIFLNGNAKYYIEENIYELVPGDVLLIPPGDMHRIDMQNQARDYERIIFYIRIEYLKLLETTACPLIEKLDEIAKQNHLIHFEKDDFDELIGQLNKLMTITAGDDFGKELLIRSYSTNIVISFIQNVLSNKNHSKQGQKTDLISKVITYINDHINEDLGLDFLAQTFYISKYHLLRKFKNHTHSTIYEYIVSKRIINAKRLLREGYTAIEASKLCGFKDYPNFYKAFVSRTGITPKEYKTLCK